MDFVIVFFRDILDGPLYIAIVIINFILICSCIGYLADNYLKRKQAATAYNDTYADVNGNTGVDVNSAAAVNQSVAPVPTSQIDSSTQVVQQTDQINN